MKEYSDICPRTLSLPRSEQFSESGSVSFEEQIISKDKYASVFFATRSLIPPFYAREYLVT